MSIAQDVITTLQLLTRAPQLLAHAHPVPMHAGCHNTKLTPILEGAPNFRKVIRLEQHALAQHWHSMQMPQMLGTMTLMQVEDLGVYGVAIPTVTGLRQVMNAMGAQSGAVGLFFSLAKSRHLSVQNPLCICLRIRISSSRAPMALHCSAARDRFIGPYSVRQTYMHAKCCHGTRSVSLICTQALTTNSRSRVQAGVVCTGRT